MSNGGWSCAPLGDLTENHDYLRVPVKEADRKSGPFPYYGASGVVDHVDGYLFDGEYLLIAEDGENLRTRKTPIAFVATGKFWVNNHAHIVRGNDRADTRFLGYALSNTDLSGYLTGSTIPKLSQGNLNRLPVIAPPMEEQLAIVSVVGTLDDKIEANRRTSEALERLARTIFRAWFVDFEPARAKAAGAASFPSMPQDVFDALPTEFVDSPIGPIPQGWEARAMSEIAEAAKGLSYKGAGLVDGPREDVSALPLHNLNSVFEGGGYKEAGIKFYSADFKPRHLIEPGDLIVTNTEQGFEYRLIGFPAIVPKRFGSKGLFSHHLFRVCPLSTSPVGRYFLFYSLLSGRVRDEVCGYTNGTTVNMLSPDGLQRPRICTPRPDVANAFETLAENMNDLKESLSDESRKLAELRDYLLPKLLSGKVRVRDAERLAESPAAPEATP